MSEKTPTRPDPAEVAAVAQRIDSLRERAEEGELGDELDDVSGGHVNSTHVSSTHTDSPDETFNPYGRQTQT